MHKGWGMWGCGIVLGAAAGFVCGHVVAWSRAELSAQSRSTEFRTESAQLPTAAAPELHDGPVYFPNRHSPGGSHANDPAMTHADAVLETGAKDAVPVDEPAELPAPADATPLPDKDQQTLRAVLDTELADLSPTDREIWLDALQGMPPADAVGVVRLWKKFGGGPKPRFESHQLDSPPKTTEPSVLLPTTNLPAPSSQLPVTGRSRPTNLLAARQLVIENLLGAGVVGFRRHEPLLTISALPGTANIAPVAADPRVMLQLAGSRIDHTPGEIVETPSPLDLAIEGDGFFVVTDPQQGQLFTRCGRFSRDADGRLVLNTSRGELPVEPQVTIPDNCATLTISMEGEVSITRDGRSPETVGTLSLALFVAPAQLAPRHDALFSPTERSGQPQIGRPNAGLRGGIIQHCLEHSNVNPATETALLEQIDDWLMLIDESAAAGPERLER